LKKTERLDLISEIWDTIIDDEDMDILTDEQRLEIDRRLESYYSNKEQGKSWEEVKKRIHNELITNS
jgi:putative addiction module component (TIGR02574 family)